MHRLRLSPASQWRLIIAQPIVGGVVGAFVGLCLTVPAVAGGPSSSVQQIRSAAAEYDAGRRAFVEKDYDAAAAHFENAFNDSPSAEALRSAIRAHRKANQLARAATLAEVALLRYPKDAPTGAVIRETLTESASKLQKVTLTCSPECGVAADGRAISLSDGSQNVFFLDPGSHDLVVSWSDERTKTLKFTARAGGRDEIAMEAPPLPPPLPPAAPPIAPSVLSAPPRGQVVDRIAEVPTKPFGPAVFIVSAALTAGGIGFVAWSGVNAENDPGTNAVRMQCVGAQAVPTCPAYEAGQAAQLRTNIALGVTGGLALTTALVGIFFTQWSAPKPHTTLALVPTGGILRGGATVGLGGTF